MSLDVYLTLPGARPTGDRIFIRENGANREISRAEWDARFPDREPVVMTSVDSADVYSANITGNLSKMAAEAGLYQALWEPHLFGIFTAQQLITPLRDGLALLRRDPERFKPFNPENGWGNYEGLVQFIADYLAACEQHPTAKVSVWR
jgi:hypothetical protein